MYTRVNKVCAANPQRARGRRRKFLSQLARRAFRSFSAMASTDQQLGGFCYSWGTKWQQGKGAHGIRLSLTFLIGRVLGVLAGYFHVN